VNFLKIKFIFNDWTIFLVFDWKFIMKSKFSFIKLFFSKSCLENRRKWSCTTL